MRPRLGPGSRLGGYELVGKLGTGGMATLFLARREGARGFERLAAVKVMHPHLAEVERLTLMFVDEARATSRIDHPNVVRVEHFGESEGVCFLAMEYVHGCSLAELMEELAEGERRLWPPLAVYLAMQIAAGLHGAHETCDPDGRPLSLVHRDVSPQNVLLSYTGHVKVIDFGIAKAKFRLVETESVRIKGKLGYMAPEQLLSRSVDPRTDVYALGIVLWEMLAMRRYHDAPNDFALVTQVKDPTPRPLTGLRGVSPELEAVILGALSPDPRARPKSARAFRRALGEACPEALGLESADVADILEAVMRDRRLAFAETLPGVITDELEAPPRPAARSLDRPLTESIDRAEGTVWTRELVETELTLTLPLPGAGGPGPGEAAEARLAPPAPARAGPLLVAGMLAVGLATGLALALATPDDAVVEGGAGGLASGPPAEEGSADDATADDASAGGAPADDAPADDPPADESLEGERIAGWTEPGEATAVSGAAARRAASRPAGAPRVPLSGPRPPAPPSGPDSEASREARASACMARGDNPCVIRLLDGQARTEPALAMLIEARRVRGELPQSLALMRRYVARYPSGARASDYRQILRRH